MSKDFDSFQFVKGATKRIVKNWIKMETPRKIPWSPIQKPIRESTVALISSGGIARNDDKPFDQEGERKNPWWGDPTYRLIPNNTVTADISVHHMHINPDFAQADLNCLLPLERLNELEKSGEIGRAAPSHYAYMGYVLEPDELLKYAIPQIITNLRKEKVDLVILVPA
ncbi:MAG: hypothetical protein JEZ06_09630 [Anaerolineaceae bacterium]|nr:hypothetical protein [Anaerolineaceae bacterium]